jgi:hypothetical protein
MKKLLIIITLLISAYLYGQEIKVENKAIETGVQKSHSYPVDARPYLRKFNELNGLKNLTPLSDVNVLKKTAFNFNVGDKKSWYATNTKTNDRYTLNSTCRAVGDYCYIFVEDKIWQKNVDEASVERVKETFDKKTPADPNKGVYSLLVDTFGEPPNIDGDPKIIILILDIVDNYDSTTGGGYIAGYFHAVDQYSKLDYSKSNEAEIYYLDGVQNNLKDENGLINAMSTTAHEFQHMIHFKTKKNDMDFFDEAWSLAAEVICGYELYNQNYYSGESNYYLFGWRSNDPDVLNDYSRAARFSLYLKEQFGVQIFKKYLEWGIDNDYDGLNTVLTQMGFSSRLFPAFLEDWFIANYINDKQVNSKWGYDYPYNPAYGELPRMNPIFYHNPNVSLSGQVYSYASQYISFTNGSNIEVSFNSSNTNLKVKAIKYGTNIAVEDVPLNQSYHISEIGNQFSEVAFIVCNIDSNSIAYNMEATGVFDNKPIEIAYDNTEPVGVYPWDIGDSVAVVFKGVEGAKLDSIRVALRTLTPLQGGVWNIANSAKYLLGNKLASFEAVGNYYVEGNYPAKWPNWVKVDLSSYNISADKDFVVSFVIDGDYLGTNNPNNKNGPNRVMHTYQPTSQSRTYTMNGDTKGWYNFYVDDVAPQDSFIVYLIRAYVSYKTTGNNDVIELLPTSYALDQNYPNPFNPSTIITYTLPEMTNVRIKIYDALGREVRSLLDEVKSAGKHNILWDGRDNSGNRVSSGTYFYQIIAGDFVQTRKMVMVK